MKKFFNTFVEAWRFIETLGENTPTKLRWVAKISKWVVTITAAYLLISKI
jgi:hypothetical protein